MIARTAFSLLTVCVFSAAAASVDARHASVEPEAKHNCWDGNEVQNSNRPKHRPSQLPIHLEKERRTQSILLFKLCISEKGTIERVLVIRPSGSSEIDSYYKEELSKWVVEPMRVKKQVVRSTLPVSIALHPK